MVKVYNSSSRDDPVSNFESGLVIGMTIRIKTIFLYVDGVDSYHAVGAKNKTEAAKAILDNQIANAAILRDFDPIKDRNNPEYKKERKSELVFILKEIKKIKLRN